MKKSIILLAVYVIICLLLCIIGAYIYMLSLASRLLVAGQKLSFFIPSFFCKGLLTVLPYFLFISSIFVVFYTIRHSFTLLETAITYSVLSILIWFVFFPFSIKYLDKVDLEDRQTAQGVITEASTDFFRENDKSVWYVVGENKENPSIIYFSLVPSKTIETKVNLFEGDFSTFYNFSNFKSERDDIYSDSLIKGILGKITLGRFVMNGFCAIKNVALKSMNKGFINYLIFVLFGFALSSIIGLSRISSWRFINFTFVLSGFCFIVLINFLFYTDFYSFSLAKYVIKYQFLPTIFNGFIGLVFTVIGVINCIIKKDPNREISK